MFNQLQGCRKVSSYHSKLWFSFMACVISFPSLAKYTDLFTEHKIMVPFNVNHPVVAVDILPRAGIELLMLGVDDSQQRKLAIYAVDTIAIDKTAINQGAVDINTEAFNLVEVIDIPNTFFGFDLGEKDTEGLSTLYFLTQSEIKKYVPAHMSRPASLETEQLVSSMYVGDKSDIFKHIKFVSDINDDGKDDLFLPHFKQFNLWLTDCCNQRHAQSLPITAKMELEHSQFKYDDAQLYFEDMNKDNKTDLVYAKDGQVIVHLQNDTMQFSVEPMVIDIISSVSAQEWWHIKDENGQELDQSDLTHRKMDAIRDINGDDIPDLVVKFTQSSGVLDKTIDYEFYYGSYQQGQLLYAQQISTKVASKDTLTDLHFVDLQDDGKFEVLVSSFDIGISQIIGALMSGSIDQDTMIFAMDEQGLFTDKPIVEQEVELTFSLSSGTTGEPLVKVLDVNGDKHKDIVYSEGTDILKVLYATPQGKRPFNRRTVKQKLQVPKSAAEVLVHDINADGKADLIFHFGSGDGPDKMREVSILLAN